MIEPKKFSPTQKTKRPKIISPVNLDDSNNTYYSTKEIIKNLTLN